MSLILNVRGPGGSGKTTAVREFLRLRNPRQLLEQNRVGAKGQPLRDKVIGYELDGNIRVVGSYEMTCGGCDSIQKQDCIKELVLSWADEGYDVIFEGLMISSVWSTWTAVQEIAEARGHEWLWVFMNTPLDQCVKNILKRNGGKPINEDLVVTKWKSLQGQMVKVEVLDMPHFIINKWAQGGEGLQRAYDFGKELHEYAK